MSGNLEKRIERQEGAVPACGVCGGNPLGVKISHVASGTDLPDEAPEERCVCGRPVTRVHFIYEYPPNSGPGAPSAGTR